MSTLQFQLCRDIHTLKGPPKMGFFLLDKTDGTPHKASNWV
jgi:hypothetical protein